jgi:ABC-type amino acid transport substrate-binding protein
MATKDALAVETLVPGQLTVCTYGGFAPVCHKNPDGHLIGLDVSFLTRFAESLRLPIVMIEKPFDLIWTLPGENVCDIAGAGVMRHDERPVGSGGVWSDAYFQVQRSLLVRSGEKTAFDSYETVAGKNIVVTRGSTAAMDAKKRYPQCKVLFVDVVAKGQGDAQDYIVKTLIANHQADAFGEGDVSSEYLLDKYSREIAGGLALADVHAMDGMPETFNFITRNASSGVLQRLNSFIAANKETYRSRLSAARP